VGKDSLMEDSYYVDIGGVKVEGYEYWIFPCLQRQKREGCTHVTAGRGEWVKDECGLFVKVDLLLAFYHPADEWIRDYERFRVKIRENEDASSKQARELVFREERLFLGYAQSRKITFGEKKSIEEVLQGHEQFQTAMGIPPDLYNPDRFK